VVQKTTCLGYAVGAYQKVKDNEGRIMPAVPAWLEMCGVHGVGAEVEVEVELPDRAMLAPPYRPSNRGFYLQRYSTSRFFL
jgi:hypothetical protein